MVVPEKVERNGSKFLYTNDYKGRVLTETQIGADGQPYKVTQNRYNTFHLLSTTECDGRETCFTYDYAGRPLSKKTGDFLEEYEYDHMNRLHKTKEWISATEYRYVVKNYDWLERVIVDQIVGMDGTIHQTNSYSYDSRGNKTRVQQGDQVTLTVYNSQNQPVEITNAMGDVTHVTYDYDHINSYGQRVLKSTTTDPLGYQTLFIYDTTNREAEIIHKNPLNDITSHQEIFYDFQGNKARIVDHVYANGKKTRTIENLFEYTLNKQLKVVIEAANTPEQKITRHSYNSAGQEMRR